MDDATLIRHTLAGRREDFDVLVERHQRALYAFVYRLVRDHDQAADIVQASFLRAYARLVQFHGDSSFATWLHQIALNECRTQKRSARRRHEIPLDDSGVQEQAVAEDPSSGWKRKIEALVERLPLRQRSVLVLRVFSDMPFKAIAEVEGISENAAKVSYHHAVTRLRQWLKEPTP